MEVRALTADEWHLKRDLRLAALKDSPDAFASTYARESHRSETDWRTWPPGGAFFTAFARPCPPPTAPATLRAPARPARGSHEGIPPLAAAGSVVGDAAIAGSAVGHALVAGSAVGDAVVGGSVVADAVVAGSVQPLGIAGTWVAAADPRTTHLISMWVAPVARGRGVAALLVDAVVGWARDRAHDRVEIEVAGGNTPALTAYLRHGFVVTQRKPFTAGSTVLVRPVK